MKASPIRARRLRNAIEFLETPGRKKGTEDGGGKRTIMESLAGREERGAALK